MKNKNPFKKNPNPKKKFFIILSVIGLVLAVVLVAGMLTEPPLFKGALYLQSYEVDPVLKEEPVLEEKSEEEETEINTGFLSTEYKVVQTPPDISFAYRDRLDSGHASIYDNVRTDREDVVMIFRLRNQGTLSAYLKSFNTHHGFNNFYCDSSDADFAEFETLTCKQQTSKGAKLVKLNYDSNGKFIDWSLAGEDANFDGYFTESELTNTSNLEVQGGSDTFFALIKDTTFYLLDEEIDEVLGKSVIELPTLEVVDANNQDVGEITIDADTATPEVMIFK